MEPSLEEVIDALRQKIGKTGDQVQDLTHESIFKQPEPPKGVDTGEMIANIVLSYRHLEDARMRLGKVLQAYHGGISPFDKKPENKQV